jgi:hypothetical protein
MNLHKIACHVLLVLAASTAMLAQAPMVEEQAPMLEETDAAELIGGTVQSAEGLEVGQVCSVALKPDGEVTEIRMTTEQALGMGERTVILPQRSYLILQGTVLLRLPVGEIRRLPGVDTNTRQP